MSPILYRKVCRPLSTHYPYLSLGGFVVTLSISLVVQFSGFLRLLLSR
jgi:hypothetical protein